MFVVTALIEDVCQKAVTKLLSEDKFASLPFLIFANKQDLWQAFPTEQVLYRYLISYSYTVLVAAPGLLWGVLRKLEREYREEWSELARLFRS